MKRLNPSSNFFVFLIGLLLISSSGESSQNSISTTPKREVNSSKALSSSAHPHLTAAMKKAMGPYLISDGHPLKKELDLLFGKHRLTKSKSTFIKSGFQIVDERPRSFIVVARHPRLPDHLIKCYLDTEYREKWDKPSWMWLVNRCEGAKKIREIIEKHEIKHFDVAEKWIYVLPVLVSQKPLPSCYTRHPALILVTDMKLVSEKENLYAWQNNVTPEILRELYLIITLAKGSSYRPDNIAYSHSGKFCFIDCEYPNSGPDYKRIAGCLNSKMRAYWNYLVKKGENQFPSN